MILKLTKNSIEKKKNFFDPDAKILLVPYEPEVKFDGEMTTTISKAIAEGVIEKAAEEKPKGKK